jgi:hypothetical protein
LDLGLDARATLQAASARIGRARHFAGRVLDLGLPGARLCGPRGLVGRATLRAASARIAGRALQVPSVGNHQKRSEF